MAKRPSLSNAGRVTGDSEHGDCPGWWLAKSAEVKDGIEKEAR